MGTEVHYTNKKVTWKGDKEEPNRRGAGRQGGEQGGGGGRKRAWEGGGRENAGMPLTWHKRRYEQY